MPIDINRHNIIEASAGTGKTYTIQNLVLEIISTKNDINLSDILIVTYTEKATGELKDRIRIELEKRLLNEKEAHLKDKLKFNLKNFENNNIHTIHGFCNKILKEYSFESNLSFNNTIVNDTDIYNQSLVNLIRDKWRLKYKDNFFDILLTSNYPNYNGRENQSEFEKIAVQLSMKFNPDRDIILPEKIDDLSEYIREIKTTLKESLSKIEKIIGEIDCFDLRNSKFYKDYSNSCQRKDKESRLVRIILPLLELISKKDDKIFSH
ncbi:MAG TPA: UvrD-helicase domain-containing protein [Spirochaetota bacterium]|nr:UvrD-helicase domain-containing protein [Spirochaetota bacterium]